MVQRPVAIGLLVCEQIIVEEKTRNITPVNCFTRRVVARFPSEPVPFVVLAFLTDGIGKVPLEMEISRLDTLEVVYRRTALLRFANPLHEVRCTAHVRTCSFPRPGQYDVMLLADKEPIAQRKLHIIAKDHPT